MGENNYINGYVICSHNILRSNMKQKKVPYFMQAYSFLCRKKIVHWQSARCPIYHRSPLMGDNPGAQSLGDLPKRANFHRGARVIGLEAFFLASSESKKKNWM